MLDTRTGGEMSGWEQLCSMGPGGAGHHQAQQEGALAAERANCIKTAQPAGQRGGSPVVFSIGVALPSMLCAFLGSTIQQDAKVPEIIQRRAKSTKAGESAGRHVL